MSSNTAKAGLTYPALSDPPNVPSNLQTLAGQLDGIVIPKYASATAMNAANPSPTGGDMCYRTDLRAYLMYDATASAWMTAAYGAWTSFTPTWTAATTNPSLGNGTLTSRWSRVGRTINWSGYFAVGTTSTGGSGAWQMSIPVPQVSTTVPFVGSANYTNVGDNYYVGICELLPGASNIVFTVKTGTSSTAFGRVTTSIPVTASTNTQISWSLTYEAAS
jgi:hypothetical protein